jgi:hypothetical protein
MAYTAPTTRSTGNLITASIWNTDLVDNISFLANPPACKATRTSTQAIVTATATAIQFNAADAYDTASMHDTVTNNTRVTMATAGLYVIVGYTEWELNATGTYRQARLRVNGTTAIAIQTHSAGTLSANTAYETSLSTIYKAAANDYVELVVQHDRGANLNAWNANALYLAVTWVGLG